MSKLKHGEAAALLHAYKACPTHYTTINTLVAKFQPLIEVLATKVSLAWKDDLIQEGNIALIKAAEKFPSTENYNRFLDYAYQSIKNGMLYFIRNTSKKQPNYVDSLEALSEDENGDTIYEIPHPINYVTSITLAIDFKYLLNSSSMKKNQFTDKEIKIFDLHFNKGYSVTEVASKIDLSVSRISKIICKTKFKVQQLLAYSSTKILTKKIMQ